MNAISNSVASSPRKAFENNLNKKPSLQREVSTSPLKLRPKAASDYNASMQFGSQIIEESKRDSSAKKKSKFALSPV